MPILSPIKLRRRALLMLAAAAGLGVSPALAQFTSFSSVANNGYAAGDINSCAVGINSLTTAGNFQFIAYYTNTGQLMVGRRTLGSSTWQAFNSGYTQGSLSDDHNIVAMTVDTAGKMHLSWGMHNVGLKYAISNASVTSPTLSSIPFTTQTSFNAPTLFAGPSNSVTYPQFYDLPDSSPDGSKLLFTYRNGSSGSGNQYFNVYNPATNSWTNNEVIDGNATNVNAYLNTLAYTSTNNLLMSWTWRATPDWQTNSNIMFAQSPSNGTTWFKQGGTTQYTLPIIQSGSPSTSVAQVIKSIPQNSSLINQTSMAVDAGDNPLIATWYAPNWNPSTNTGDPNRQYMLVYYDGASWRSSQISNRTTDNMIDTSAFAVRDLGRPIVLTDDNDHVLVVTRSTDTSMGNYDNPAVTDNELVVYYNTLTSLHSATPAAWQSVAIDAANMGSMEPTYDAALWKSQRKLSLFYQATELGQASSPISVLDWDSVGFFADLALNNYWNNIGGGNWDTAGNWTNGVPNAIGARALFGGGPTPPGSSSTITISGTKNIHTLTFNHPTFSYSLVSGVSGALAFNASNGVMGNINVISGSHLIAVPVAISGATVNVSTAGGSVLSISGNVTGTSGLTKSGGGTLTLSGTNSYSGNTIVSGGTLRANQGAGLSVNSNLSLNGGVLETGANLTRTLGNGAGQIQLPGGNSGFSASGANVTVTLSGGGQIQWGGSTFNPSMLVLNGADSTHNLSLTNPISLGNSTRSIWVGANSATLSGVLSGSGGVTKEGAGTLVLGAVNTFAGATTINNGTINVTGSIASTSAINFNSGGSGVLRVGTSNGLGSATINIASNGGAVGPSTRLELTGSITLANPITFAQRNNSSVAIQSIGGNNTLSGPITLVVGGNQARVQVDSGQLTLSGPITTNATAARNLYLQGAGNGSVSGVISDNASNTNGKINVIKEGAGSWTLLGNNTYTGTTTVSAGTLNLDRSFRTSSSLSVAAGAKAAMTPRTTSVKTLQIGNLNLDAAGTLDFADNDLVVDSGSFLNIRDAVISGFGTSGPGIVSSTSDGSQILALFDNALVGASTWNGGSISPSAVVAKFTFFGDVNIDGQVSGDDYTVIDANLNTIPPAGLAWLSGDANLDGAVTGDDYTVIDANLGLGAGMPLASSRSVGLSAVPEPAGLGALAAFGAILASQHRRRGDQ